MRRTASVAAALVLALCAACGSGDSGDQPPPASPGANIDRESDNRITGPINRARDVADDAETRGEQMERDLPGEP